MLVGLLTVVGLQLSLLTGAGAWPPNRRVLWAVLLATGFTGLLIAWTGARRAVGRGLDWFDALARARPAPLAVVFAVLAGVYLYSTAAYQGRSLTPKYQDEFSYLLQARMLSDGHLSRPAHPVGEAFESFQVLTRPRYTSIYFPGAAALYAPAARFGLATWVAPLLLASTVVGLWFLVVSELTDGVTGAAAAVLALGLTMFRLQSVMVMAHIPLLLLGLTMIWAWLRWRRALTPTAAIAYATVFGTAAGWAAITRPVDALCFALPIGVAMLVATIRQPARGRVVGLVAACLAATPFLAVQATFNRQVTGSVFTAPFSAYADRYFPGTRYGFRTIDQAARPETRLPQFHRYYDAEVRPRLFDHTPVRAVRRWVYDHLPATLRLTLPHALLIALLPVGLLALRDRPVAAAPVAALALFPILYWPYAFFLPHYTLTVAPAVGLLALLGVHALQAAAGTRFAPAARAGLLAGVVGVTVAELPELNRGNFDEFFPAAGIAEVDRVLRASIPANERALVLFRFPPDGNPHEEPVYNIEASWPDDGRIIRAHDLGEGNSAVFAYYAQRQPDRQVWVYDRADGRMVCLGRVSELAGAPIIVPETTRPNTTEGKTP